MKLMLRIGIGVVVILLVAVLVGVLMIDGIARRAVEQNASDALGVSTTLDRASVGIRDRRFTMAGLDISNPGGFDTPHFLRLDDGHVNVALGTLRKETVELPTLYLEGIDINLEQKEGRSNYKVILDHMEQMREETPADPDGKKFIVRELVIRDINVHVDLLPVGGDLSRLDMVIDEIILTDVGTETDRGVVLRELSGVIIQSIFLAILNKGGDILPDDLLNDLGGALASVGEIADFKLEVAGEALGQIGEAGRSIGESVGGALEDIGGGLRGLFGNDDDD